MTKGRCLSATSNRYRRRIGRLGTLQRLLAEKATAATKRADQAIEWQFLMLEMAPDIGRPFPELAELCEFVIAFGDSGYVA